jgi:uncharacterized protein
MLDAETRLFRPAKATGTGVLVLAGSSGRIDAIRAELLSGYGALALALRWFGGHGQQPGPFEVPIELFISALDDLAVDCDRLTIVETSFGAEAALVTASHDDRVDATIALAPSPVVWGGWDGRRWTSHWTAGGVPIPFVPFVEDWEPTEAPPAYLALYQQSLQASTELAERASIRVENIAGEVVLIAGGDDRVWPSLDFARQIEARRTQHGLETVVVSDESAGHRTILPGESLATGGITMQRGGNNAADAALGASAWPHIVAALKLHKAS